MITSEELIAKLKSALQSDGDFPVSARIVSELRQLTSDPKTSAEQVTEVILREPSLGTRVLHFVNSAFMRRAKPILTVSQAVVQIGMKPLAELCSGLVLLQKFVPAARRSSPFASCLKRTVLVSLLSGSIKANTNSVKSKSSPLSDEGGYLVGQFAELGVLLLGFYFPEILEAASKRSEQKNQDLASSINDLTGLSPWTLSVEVIDALGLPKYFIEVLHACDSPGRNPDKPLTPEIELAARVLICATDLGSCIADGKSKIELDAKIAMAQNSLEIDPGKLRELIADLPRMFRDHCSSVELALPALPDFLSTYSISVQDSQTLSLSSNTSEFEAFLREVRQMVEHRESTASIITSVMETIAYGLKFDRVFLMLLSPNKQKLMGRMLLGTVNGFDPKRFEKSVNEQQNCPALKAFREGRAVFKGDPIFDDGWPISAIPVGHGARAIGVIYSDRIPEDGSLGEDLSQKDQASMTVLGELLERSIVTQTRGP